MADSVFTLSAPAKLNLFLHVVGRRADGYHLLQSLIFFAAAGDALHLQRQDSFTLTLEGEFAPGLEGQGNLVVQAYQLLCMHYGAAAVPAYAVTLCKNLPVAAGLGGGSADAAALLRFYAAQHGLTLPSELLLKLGAEIPACMALQPVLVEGVGEVLTPAAPLPSWGLVLVNSRVALPTAQVFAGLKPEDYWQEGGAEGNSLTRAACKIAPQIQDCLTALSALPGCLKAQMSGSGASCFGIFADHAEAAKAAAILHQQHPEWWVKASEIYKETTRSVGDLTEQGQAALAGGLGGVPPTL